MSRATFGVAELVLLVTVGLISVPTAASSTGCHSIGCVERVAMHQCSQARPVPCIRRAAIHWRVSFPVLLRKARCESTLDSWAYFSQQHAETAAERAWAVSRRPELSVGLFAFLSSTWRTTPYRARSPWSAKWAALGAGWMHHVGRGGEWDCA